MQSADTVAADPPSHGAVFRAEQYFGPCLGRQTMHYNDLDKYDTEAIQEYVTEVQRLARGGGGSRPLPFNYIMVAKLLGLGVGHAYFGQEHISIESHLTSLTNAVERSIPACRAAPANRSWQPRCVQLYRELIQQQAEARAKLYMKAQQLSKEQTKETDDLLKEMQDTAKQHQLAVKEALYAMYERQQAEDIQASGMQRQLAHLQSLAGVFPFGTMLPPTSLPMAWPTSAQQYPAMVPVPLQHVAGMPMQPLGNEALMHGFTENNAALQGNPSMAPPFSVLQQPFFDPSFCHLPNMVAPNTSGDQVLSPISVEDGTEFQILTTEPLTNANCTPTLLPAPNDDALAPSGDPLLWDSASICDATIGAPLSSPSTPAPNAIFTTDEDILAANVLDNNVFFAELSAAGPIEDDSLVPETLLNSMSTSANSSVGVLADTSCDKLVSENNQRHQELDDSLEIAPAGYTVHCKEHPDLDLHQHTTTCEMTEGSSTEEVAANDINEVPEPVTEGDPFAAPEDGDEPSGTEEVGLKDDASNAPDDDDDAESSDDDLEAQRLRIIQRNQAMLAKLGLSGTNASGKKVSATRMMFGITETEPKEQRPRKRQRETEIGEDAQSSALRRSTRRAQAELERERKEAELRERQQRAGQLRQAAHAQQVMGRYVRMKHLEKELQFRTLSLAEALELGILQLSLRMQKLEYHHQCLKLLEAEQRHLFDSVQCSFTIQGIQQLIELQEGRYTEQQRQAIALFCFLNHLHLVQQLQHLSEEMGQLEAEQKQRACVSRCWQMDVQAVSKASPPDEATALILQAVEDALIAQEKKAELLFSQLQQRAKVVILKLQDLAVQDAQQNVQEISEFGRVVSEPRWHFYVIPAIPPPILQLKAQSSVTQTMNTTPPQCANQADTPEGS